MPELPEVETVKIGLRKQILGKTIKGVLLSEKALRFPIVENYENILQNSKIVDINRRAKIIIIELDNGFSLLMHLGMTGKLVFNLHQLPEKLHKHNHFILEFSDGSFLIYNDVRRFGFVDIEKTDSLKTNRHFQKLGPEPLSEKFNSSYLYSALKNKRIPIKIALMQNSVVVGVGNIYANEALFRAKIYPFMQSNVISKNKLDKLVSSIKETLKDALEQGGSTLRDYVQTDGSLGYFQNSFSVYGREGKDCPICESKIQKETLGQRSTYFCKKCQKG